MKKWCWTCTAKAGFGVGLVAIVLGRQNPWVSILAIVLSLAALIMHKKELDKDKHGVLIVLGVIGLTLGIIMLLSFLFTS